jgi:hypothetical protein
MLTKSRSTRGPATALLALVLLSVAGQVHAGEPLKPGSKFPTFSLDVLNPKECGTTSFDSAKFVGLNPTKPATVLIVVFGAWSCKPCKRAIAHLEKLRSAEAKPAWRYVVVVEDRDEAERSKFLEHMKNAGNTAPVLADLDGLVLKRAGCERLPCTLAGNAWGIVVGLWQKYDDEIQKQLDNMVKESKDW